MKYNIFLKRPEGTYKVSIFESGAEDAARQLSLYLFRHYPVSFFDNDMGNGDSEKVLKDSRSGKIVWREGELNCRLEEGYFFTEVQDETEDAPCWWKDALPASKKVSIELDIQNAWKKGFAEGYAKGVDEGREQGYRQGVYDKAVIEISEER